MTPGNFPVSDALPLILHTATFLYSSEQSVSGTIHLNGWLGGK